MRLYDGRLRLLASFCGGENLLRGFRGVPKYTAGRSGPHGPAHVVKTAVCWFGEMFFILKLLCCTSSAEFSENDLGFLAVFSRKGGCC